MRRKIFPGIFFLAVGAILVFPSPLEPTEMAPTSIFPDLEGWEKKGNPQLYTPGNLYEYIDGAAESYLGYDFQELATLTYENKSKHSLTVDIYRHGSANDGFGIYSQEKPTEGQFLPIGTEGYYERGILNFFNGNFYVKLSGFDIGEDDKTVLTTAARKIDRGLGVKAGFPPPLKCFPQTDRIPHSERYIAANFLGHGFLHSAFVADYKAEGKKFQLFIIEATDEKKAAALVESYREFASGKGSEVKKTGGGYRFQDPYYRSSGPMNIRKQGKYAWGLFTDDPKQAGFFLAKIGENLSRYGLIE